MFLVLQQSNPAFDNTQTPRKETSMHVERLHVHTSGAIPLMAALPYRISVVQPEATGFEYNPNTQLTVFAGRGFSTCREDESINPIFGKSKSDTQKDD
jgi:hypothetical protein